MQWVIICVVTLMLTRPVVLEWHKHPGAVLHDFADFYCAGATKNAGGNPYLWKDDDGCGKSVIKPAYVEVHRPPAPIPGYDLAFFQSIAHLSYKTASMVWLTGSALALLTAVYFLSLVTEFPPLIVFAALAVPTRAGFSLGQFLPFLLAAISYAAYAIKQKQYAFAGAAAVATLVEPHVGVPVVIALYFWLPETRIALVTGAAVLIASSLTAVGLNGNLEFFRTILPLHLAAEAPFKIQYSLTWLLYFFGMSEALAIKLGTLSYYGGIALSLYLTRKLPREFTPVVPAAIAVLGGPFIHVTQVEIATACALMLAAYYNSIRSWLALVILSMVWFEIPWLTHRLDSSRVGCCIAIALLVFYALRNREDVFRYGAAVGAAVAYFAITMVILKVPSTPIRYPEDISAYLASASAFGQYTNVPWGAFIHRSTDFASLNDLVRKVPLWCGLVLVTLECFRWQPKSVRSSVEVSRSTDVQHPVHV